jgi:hypothetical protein
VFPLDKDLHGCRPYGNYPRILIAVGSLHGVVNQFAAERNIQELSIRYVSGLRDQTLFPFSSFPRPDTIRMDKFLRVD